jgi:hypothetical protein
VDKNRSEELAMRAIATEAEMFAFPEGLEDNSQPVNMWHLTVAIIAMSVTAYGLAAFAHLLS